MAQISLKADMIPPQPGTLSLPSLLGAVLIGLCLCAWRWIWQSGLFRSQARIKNPTNKTDDKSPTTITPLMGFNWETAEPLQLRPFRGKEKYNLTMALETLEPSELIPIDKTYKDRLTLRKGLLRQYHDIVVAINEDGNPKTDALIRAAVSELYTFVLGEYLPSRYPSMFKLRSSDKGVFENLVTGETWPTTITSEISTIRALETLTQTIDEDFLVLLPELSPSSLEQPRYILQAYTTCFPSGFNPREKLGRRLADIHSPVPGYAEKLERSMDRFFARVEVGKYVKRVNWSITTGARLFAAFGEVHGSSGDTVPGQDRAKDELDLDKTVLRCERQTLHRLPRSKALVFAFHTYTYPIRQIKHEGLGEELAVAIDGLKKGNVPAMNSYKRGDVWGEALKEFLRS